MEDDSLHKLPALSIIGALFEPFFLKPTVQLLPKPKASPGYQLSLLQQ
jgi:hypothetical protein